MTVNTGIVEIKREAVPESIRVNVLAALCHDFWCALDEDAALPVGSRVERGHPLVLRLERNRIDARLVAAQLFDIAPQFRGGDNESSFRRIA